MARATDSVDVVIVGAGLAGLTAACELERAGLTVHVLEAAEEVGGRTRSRVIDGRVIDVGGELVGTGYGRIRGLVRGLGLHLDRALPFPRLRLPQELTGLVRPGTVGELLTVDRRVRDLSHRLDPVSPWTHPDAPHLDHLSLADWLDALDPSPQVRQLVQICAKAFTTAEAQDLSLLHLLLWLRPGRGLSTALRETRWRIREGAQEIARRLSARLHRPVRLHSPVQQISTRHDQVQVITRTGESWRAEHAAVCTPLATTHLIDFQPDLPETLGRLHAEVVVPPIAKLVVVPPRSSMPSRSVLAVGDAAMPLVSLGRAHGTGFAYGPDADLPTELLVDRLLSRLELSAPQPHHVEAWHRDPFTGGGYVAHPPGFLTRYGPVLRASAGRVHLAGGDRSSWPGTLEGAVEDGHRVACEVLAARM